jgi:putative transposase
MPARPPRDYLRRLPSAHYRGRAYVHWSMTIEERKKGWLTPTLYFKFREILTHTAFRYGLACPMYCCMPDHLHLLWVGIVETCDQRNAAQFFRRQLNLPLSKVGVALQKQPFDHVLREGERQEGAFQVVAEYIARNPERAGLVPPDGFRQYRYTGCLVPGYPDLSPWQRDYWDRFWRLYSRLCKRGLLAIDDEETPAESSQIPLRPSSFLGRPDIE